MVKDRLASLQAAVKEWEADQLDLDYDFQNYGITNYAVDIDQDEEAGYMDHFFSEVKQSREWIATIRQNVAEIRTLHGNLLSSPRPDETMKAELDVRQDTIKQLAKKINNNLKSLEKRICQEEEDLGPEDPVPAGLRIRRTQHATTLHLFVEAVTEFNSEQVDYKEKCEERIQRIASIAKAEVSDEKLEELLEQGNYGSIFNSDIITETQETKRQLEDIHIRHEELLRLEKSISELRDLFVEMAILVEQQGDLINSIEHHVLEAGEAVETAKVQTRKAIRYKGKARKKKLILIGLAVILILLLLVYIYFSWIKPFIGDGGSTSSNVATSERPQLTVHEEINIPKITITEKPTTVDLPKITITEKPTTVDLPKVTITDKPNPITLVQVTTENALENTTESSTNSSKVP